MRYLFKPGNQAKIRLFANSFEALVFWLALGGIIFLAIISFYRAYHLQKIVDQYNQVTHEVNPLILKVNRIIAINDSLQTEQRLLLHRSDSLKSEIDLMKEKLKNLKIYKIIPEKKSRTINLPGEN